MGIDISVKSKKYNCFMHLDEKISFVLGESGKGKTVFTRLALDSYNTGVDINVSNGFELVVLTGAIFRDFLRKANKHISSGKYKDLNEYWSDSMNFPYSESVIIVDDNDFITSREFACFVNADKYNYYLLINRTQLSELGYSIDAVFEFKANGKEHSLERKYNYPSQM